MAHYLATVQYRDGSISPVEMMQPGYRAARDHIIELLSHALAARRIASIAIDRLDGTLDSPTLTIEIA